MPGRNPIPTAVKRAEGYRDDRINEDEPQPSGDICGPPACLNKAESADWVRIVAEQADMGVLKPPDYELLLIYVQELEKSREAQKQIKKLGLLVKTGAESLKANPAIGIKSSADQMIIQLAGQLGRSPAARTKIHGPPAPQANPLFKYRRDLDG